MKEELKKYDFGYPGVSRLIALSGISGPSRFDCTKESQGLEGFFPNSYGASYSDLKERNKSVVFEKHEHGNLDES